MVSRARCTQCKSLMNRCEARVRLGDDTRPKSKQTRKPVGWICFTPGCDGMIRTWFEVPITPP